MFLGCNMKIHMKRPFFLFLFIKYRVSRNRVKEMSSEQNKVIVNNFIYLELIKIKKIPNDVCSEFILLASHVLHSMPRECFGK